LIGNKEELPHHWKEPVFLPIHKKGDKTGCSNYRGISLLSTLYRILSIILLSGLITYGDEIVGDHLCGFELNTSRTHQAIFVRYGRKGWEYNGTLYQLFIDFKKAYDSVRREVLYNVLIMFGIPRKLVGLIRNVFK
jgi:sorting nexin-29